MDLQYFMLLFLEGAGCCLVETWLWRSSVVSCTPPSLPLPTFGSCPTACSFLCHTPSWTLSFISFIAASELCCLQRSQPSLKVCRGCPPRDALLLRPAPHAPGSSHPTKEAAKGMQSWCSLALRHLTQDAWSLKEVLPGCEELLQVTEQTEGLCYGYYERQQPVCKTPLLRRKATCTIGAVREKNTAVYLNGFFGYELTKQENFHKIMRRSQFGTNIILLLNDKLLFKSWKH